MKVAARGRFGLPQDAQDRRAYGVNCPQCFDPNRTTGQNFLKALSGVTGPYWNRAAEARTACQGTEARPEEKTVNLDAEG